MTRSSVLAVEPLESRVVPTITLVSDIRAGAGDSNPHDFATLNGVVYFSASPTDGQPSSAQLYRYDPAAGTTTKLSNFANPTTTSNTSGLTAFANQIVFAAIDATGGLELYRYVPGQAAATLLADLNKTTATAGSNPAGFTELGGKLYFVADDGVTGTELWVYDGTSVTRLSDINPGANGSSPSNLTAFNGKLYFSAYDQATNALGVTTIQNSELWRYDPSDGSLVKYELATQAIPAGWNGGSQPLEYRAVLNNVLYFGANGTVGGVDQGEALWKLDAGGGPPTFVGQLNNATVPAFNFNGTIIPAHGASDGYADITVLGGKLYMRANDGDAAYGDELYVYDPGTNSFGIAKDVWPGNGSTAYPNNEDSSPGNLTVLNNKLYFSADAPQHLGELWEYDPATAAARRLTTINPSTGARDVNNGALVWNLTPLNGFLHFSASATGSFTAQDLYSYDPGTDAVTKQNQAGSSVNLFGVAVVGSTLYFAATDGSSGYELFRYVVAAPAPTVTNVTATTANGTYGPGDVVSVTVTFSAAVSVTGTPRLALNAGAAVANYASGSGTSTLAFAYTVGALGSGQDAADLDYDAASSLALNGGAIQGSGGTGAVLTLPAPGAAGSLGANKNIVIDTTAPVVTLTAKPTDPSAAAGPGFSFTAADATALTTQAKLDGGVFATVASPFSYSGLSDGSHTVTVRATDAAGNVGTASYTWRIDTTPPTATLLTTPPAFTNSTSASFTFGGTDPASNGYASGVSRLEGSLDGAAFATVSSPVSLTGLAEGSHTYSVRAVDGVGNVGPATSHAWTVDLTAPVASASGGPTGFTAATTAAFALDGSDPTSGGVASGVDRLEWSLDGGAFATGTGMIPLSGLAEGSHTFAVRAVDQVGNVGAATTYTWSIDLTNPTAAFTATPPAYANSSSATVTFDATDPTSGGVAAGVAGFEVRLDGGAFAPASSPVSLTGLSKGSHTVEVRAVDAAGNVGDPESYTWTVDLTRPAVTIDTPAVGFTTVSFPVTYSDSHFDRSTLSPGDVTVSTTGTVTYTGLDVSGTGATRTVTLTGVAGIGTLAVSLAAGTGADLAGNLADAAGPGPSAAVAENQPPVATADTLPAGIEDATRTVPIAELLANDLAGPASESSQTLTLVSVGNVVGGTVTVVGSDVVFVPTPNWFGTAGFDYTVRDDGSSNGTPDPKAATARVTFEVTPVADTPAVAPAATVEDTPTASSLVLTVSPADGPEVRFFQVTNVRNGALFLADGVTPAGDGAFLTVAQGAAGLVFAPTPDANGGDGAGFGFDVRASLDAGGAGISPVATAAITVASVNDVPRFTPGPGLTHLNRWDSL